MRCACIDIGSNTTRLLVAEREGSGLREVACERIFNRDAAPAESVPRLLEAAREAGAEETIVVGTAACRADPALAPRGVDVRILSPEEEARYAFGGAVGSLTAPPAGPLAVVDVGGGSSEIVCGTADGGVSWSTSLPLGSASLAASHVHADPPTAPELDAVRSALARAFAGVEPPPVGAAFAVGGSATSLRRLVGDTLDHTTLTRAIDAVCGEPSAVVARRFDLHPERVRVLPAGMLLLDAAASALGHSLQIVCGGLREGVLLEKLT